eukprot:m.53006 g.53006  ORF g.53006 m.53006 type:complete len:505 (+) comp18341_c0_seq1:186-1700(+)
MALLGQQDSMCVIGQESQQDPAYNFDLVVIGGGSGGLACSKAAAGHGAKVAVCDFVKPSPQGTSWGLGGTCVNVGCIPKKLMHQAALLGHALEDAPKFGWQNEEKAAHKWEQMVGNVQDHIGSLNWGYKTALRSAKVKYMNAYATFMDPHTLKTVNKRGQETIITARNFVIATGGRPRYPDIPGAKELGITSDDLFSLPHSPGKTLVVGASYVALECAGFLTSLGYDTTVMVRSILLRGFDQQMADKIGKFMESHGTKFIRSATPSKLEKRPDGKITVVFSGKDTEESEDVFDTVLFAIGRDPCVNIGLEKAGVKLHEKSSKITTNEADQTNIEHIYAIGDVSHGRLELTPTAIKAGELLAARLYGQSTKLMDYVNIPTTVFTPLEYGTIGYPEEQAIEKFGNDNIEVFHATFQPLEYTVAKREANACYVKLICDKSDSLRVVGFHLLGPNAGEATQGFGLAFKLGATKEHFDDLVGIHPTNAEVFTTLNITKSSGVDATKSNC